MAATAAQPVVVGRATGSANPTTSFTVTIPASTRGPSGQHDLLLLFACNRDATTDPTVTDDDTGGNTWTSFHPNTNSAKAYYKWATSGTASKTITASGFTGSSAGVLVVLRYAKGWQTGTGTDWLDQITDEGNASGNETHAAITPGADNCLVMLAVFNNGNDNAVTSPAATDPATLTTLGQHLSTGGSDCAVFVAGAPQTTAGSTGSLTWSQTDITTRSYALAVRPDPNVKREFLTTTGANTWTKASDWNDSVNTVEAIGGGGAGEDIAGGGGGGGAYSFSDNVDLSGAGSSIDYFVATGGTSASANGGDTGFNGTTLGGATVSAAGGSGSTGTGGGAAGGTTGNGDVKFAGGAGGNGDSGGQGGGGGGGGGPGGAGKNGGNGATGTSDGGGGGGGAGGALSTAGSSGGASGGNGGAGPGGTGGGTGAQSPTAGTVGGGGGGSNRVGAQGGDGTEYDPTHGAGGGGGAGGFASDSGGNNSSGGNGGLYGGGGGGSGENTTTDNPGTGAQGIVILHWVAGSNKTLAAGGGSYAVTGTAATPKHAWRPSAGSGSIAVSGTAATPKVGFKTAAGGGSYSVTGTTASFVKTWRPTADSGSYAVSGTNASPLHGWKVTADGGSYAVSGTDATLTKTGAFSIGAEGGSYSVSGTSASVLHGWLVTAEGGSYSVTGTDATLTIEAASEQDEVHATPDGSWSPRPIRPIIYLDPEGRPVDLEKYKARKANEAIQAARKAVRELPQEERKDAAEAVRALQAAVAEGMASQIAERSRELAGHVGELRGLLAELARAVAEEEADEEFATILAMVA